MADSNTPFLLVSYIKSVRHEKRPVGKLPAASLLPAFPTERSPGLA